MNFTYTVEKVYAPDNSVLLRFEKEGMPPVFKRTTVSNLSDEGVLEAAQNWISFAYSEWEKLENSTDYEVSQDTFNITFKPVIEEPDPEYDANLFELIEESEETDTHVIKRKRVQALSPEQVHAKLEQRRTDKRLAFRLLRDSIVDAPINNIQVRSDDRERIHAVINAWESMGNPDTVDWVMANNTNEAVSLAQLKSVIDEYNLRLVQTFSLYSKKSAEVLSSENPEAVQWGE